MRLGLEEFHEREPMVGGKKASMTAPFNGDAVLYLVQSPVGVKTVSGPTAP